MFTRYILCKWVQFLATMFFVLIDKNLDVLYFQLALSCYS